MNAKTESRLEEIIDDIRVLRRDASKKDEKDIKKQIRIELMR
jgi:hypothetical protein